MIAGYNNEEFLKDLKYNLTPDLLEKLALTKKQLRQEYNDKKRNSQDRNISCYLHGAFEDKVLPSIYNLSNGYELQDDFIKQGNSNVDNIALEKISNIVNSIGSSAKYEEGTTLERCVNSIYNRYCYQNQNNNEEDQNNNGNGKPGKGELSDQELKEIQDKINQFTCASDDDDNSEDVIFRDDNTLLKLPGYQRLLEWLKEIEKTTISSKKSYRPIQKISDLQKVSPVELVKPRALLMKKIVNKELWCRQKVPNNRFMNIMTDASGSMQDYFDQRNTLIKTMFNDCIRLKIDLKHQFWQTRLCSKGLYGIQDIKSIDTLNGILRLNPDGSDRMGYCVVEKLRLLNHTVEKQYLLCISDGTGSLDSDEQAHKIYQLAKEKNVDVKFALFSRGNNKMYSIKKDDMFYVYQK